MRPRTPVFKYIYGPVFSWRLGRSLGIDPLSQSNKVCGFDCAYCQLGRAAAQPRRRRVYVPVREIMRELAQVPREGIDCITFSGRGEPTAAQNLGRIIRAVARAREEPVAVITNGSLLHRKAVRRELTAADIVLVKLDAASSAMLRRVNNPEPSVRFEKLVAGIKALRREFSGILALRVMFVQANLPEAPALAALAREIAPDEVQLNTPLRPSACRPLPAAQLARLKRTVFKGMRVRTVYERARERIKPFDAARTSARRGTPCGAR